MRFFNNLKITLARAMVNSNDCQVAQWKRNAAAQRRLSTAAVKRLFCERDRALSQLRIARKNMFDMFDEITLSNRMRFHAEEMLRSARLYSSRLRPGRLPR